MTKATFEAMSRDTFFYLVLMPDGEEMEIEMRAQTSAEVLEIERAHPLPKAPPSKTDPYHKIGERVFKVYDPRDPGYLEEVQHVQRARTLHRIVGGWVADIPGDTVPEQMAALEALPAPALNALVRCVNETSVAGDVLARPFRSAGNTEE